MEKLIEQIQKNMEDFKTESQKQINGNKAAGKRARKISLELGKQLKEFRTVSVTFDLKQ